MAIINTFIEETGIIVENACCRVEIVNLSRFSENATAVARCYKDIEAFNNALPAFKDIFIEFEYDAINSTDNPYVAAYLHIKTLPEFTNAADLI